METSLVASFNKLSLEETPEKAQAPKGGFKDKFGVFGETLAEALPCFSLDVVGVVAAYLRTSTCSIPRLQLSTIVITDAPAKYRTIEAQKAAIEIAERVYDGLTKAVELHECADAMSVSQKKDPRLLSRVRCSVQNQMESALALFKIDLQQVYFTKADVETMRQRLLPEVAKPAGQIIGEEMPFVLTMIRDKLPAEKPVYETSRASLFSMMTIAKELRECLKKDDKEQTKLLIAKLEALEIDDRRQMWIDAFKRTGDVHNFERNVLEDLIGLGRLFKKAS